MHSTTNDESLLEELRRLVHLQQEQLQVHQQLVRAMAPAPEFISFEEAARRLRVSQRAAADLIEEEGLEIVVAAAGGARKRNKRSVFWPDLREALRQRARRAPIAVLSSGSTPAASGEPVILKSGLLD